MSQRRSYTARLARGSWNRVFLFVRNDDKNQPIEILQWLEIQDRVLTTAEGKLLKGDLSLYVVTLDLKYAKSLPRNKEFRLSAFDLPEPNWARRRNKYWWFAAAGGYWIDRDWRVRLYPTERAGELTLDNDIKRNSVRRKTTRRLFPLGR